MHTCVARVVAKSFRDIDQSHVAMNYSSKSERRNVMKA